MKEVASAFGSEIFRPLMTLVLPGSIALVPWLFMIQERWPNLIGQIQRDHYEVAAVIVVLAIVTGIGMLLEDWGSWLEWLMDKVSDRKTNQGHTRDWYRYLCLSFEHEPVGHRYLKSLVLRLKFELDTGVAFLTACITTCFTSLGSWKLAAALGCFGVYLIAAEAWSTQRRLSTLRRELLAGLAQDAKAGQVATEAGGAVACTISMADTTVSTHEKATAAGETSRHVT